MRLLPIGHDHERCGSAQQTPKSDRWGDRRGDYQCLPLQHLSPHPSGDPTGRHREFAGREDTIMSDNDLTQPNLSRRDLLSAAAVTTGALVIGFWMPPRAQAQTVNPEGAAWA